MSVLAAAIACKGDDGSSARPSPSSAGTAASSSSDQPSSTGFQSPDARLFRAGDDSVAGHVLSVLGALDAPLLTGDPACAEYNRNMSSLLADMGHQLRRLGDRGRAGATVKDIAGFARWLDVRAGMLEQISRAKALADDELGRRHREFAAATSDLSQALGEAFSSRANELTEADIARLNNAADNLAVTTQALEAQCRG